MMTAQSSFDLHLDVCSLSHGMPGCLSVHLLHCRGELRRYPHTRWWESKEEISPPLPLSSLGEAISRNDLTAVHEILVKIEEGADNELSFQVWTKKMQDLLNSRNRGDVAFRDKDFKTAIDCYTQVAVCGCGHHDVSDGPRSPQLSLLAERASRSSSAWCHASGICPSRMANRLLPASGSTVHTWLGDGRQKHVERRDCTRHEATKPLLPLKPASRPLPLFKVCQPLLVVLIRIRFRAGAVLQPSQDDIDDILEIIYTVWTRVVVKCDSNETILERYVCELKNIFQIQILYKYYTNKKK